jgi:hypothetical protein
MTKSTTNNSPPPQHRSDVVLMSHVDDEEEEKRKNIITATTKGITLRSLLIIVVIYIIIWLIPYVLSVQSLSPPKPAGLDPPIFASISKLAAEHQEPKKNFKKNFRNLKKKKNLKKILVNFFLFKFFHEIAEHSVAISEL